MTDNEKSQEPNLFQIRDVALADFERLRAVYMQELSEHIQAKYVKPISYD